jgi:hypothetical protein
MKTIFKLQVGLKRGDQYALSSDECNDARSRVHSVEIEKSDVACTQLSETEQPNGCLADQGNTIDVSLPCPMHEWAERHGTDIILPGRDEFWPRAALIDAVEPQKHRSSRFALGPLRQRLNRLARGGCVCSIRLRSTPIPVN